MSWKPPSEGTLGEEAMMQAFYDARMTYQWQKQIKTRGYPYPYKCDFIVSDFQAWNPNPKGIEVVCEVQGGLHFKTWGGKPAVKRKIRDDSRRFNLTQEGYNYVEGTDKEAKNNPHLILDRVLQALEQPKGTLFYEVTKY